MHRENEPSSVETEFEREFRDKKFFPVASVLLVILGTGLLVAGAHSLVTGVLAIPASSSRSAPSAA